MDYHSLYARFIDATTDLIKEHLTPAEADDFLRHTVSIGEAITEVERKEVVRAVCKSLSTKGKSRGKTEYVFLTVNFDPSKSFEECFKVAQKLGKRKIWAWCAWVHEQRSDSMSEAGHGHHVHLVGKLTPAASNARSVVKVSLIKVCDTRNHHIFNWKWIPQEYIIDKYRYISSSKALEKQAKQVIDVAWREQNNISPIYYNGTTGSEIEATYAPPEAEAEA